MINARRISLFTIVALAAITGYFLWFSREGFRAGFSFDDLVSIYHAEQLGWWGHLRDIVEFFRFSVAFRPAGTLFYLGMFESFGFNALAFRIAMHLVMVLNLWLGYALARKLTATSESAALCIALFAFHGRYNSLYTNTGFVYDALCLTFFLAGFLYYLEAPKPKLWIWSALLILGLNSKEMSVTLPCIIGVWELLQPERRKRWWLFPLVGNALVAAFILGRLILPPEGLVGISSYHPDLSLTGYFEHVQGYLKEVAYDSKWLSGTKSAVLWSAAVLIALVSRNAALRLAVAWCMVSIMPLAFITHRPVGSAIIPMFGLTLFLGEMTWSATWALARRLPRMTPRRWGSIAFVAVFLLMIQVHRRHGLGWVGFQPEHNQIAHVTSEMRQWQPQLASGKRTLILKTPFPMWDWMPTFLAADLAREPGALPGKPRIDVNSLVVYEASNLHFYFPPETRMSFDVILSMENGHLIECDATPWANRTVNELGQATCQPIVK